MRLTKDDFKTIRRLESEYGSLVNVSEYNKYLQAIRKKALTRVKEPVPLLSSQYRRNSRYNLKIVSKVADLRQKGYTLNKISLKTGINFHSVVILTNIYKIRIERQFICQLVKEKVELIANNFDNLARKVNEYGYNVTSNRLKNKCEGKLPKKEKEKYQNFIVRKKVKITAPSKEKMKEICYKTKRASCPNAQPEDIVDFLNNVNGREMFSYEETFMYDD